MKKLILLILVSCTLGLNAQTWKSMSRTGTYGEPPIHQFSINPYTNDIWMIGDTKMVVIENDGNIEIFTPDFSSGFLWGADLCLAFTQNHVYYAHDNYGLFTFDN